MRMERSAGIVRVPLSLQRIEIPIEALRDLIGRNEQGEWTVVADGQDLRLGGGELRFT